MYVEAELLSGDVFDPWNFQVNMGLLPWTKTESKELTSW